MVQKKKTTEPKVKEKTAIKKKRPKKEKVEKKPKKKELKVKIGKKKEEKSAIKEKLEVKEEKPIEKLEEKPEIKEKPKKEEIKKEKPIEKIKHYEKRKLAPGENATFKLIYKKKKRRPHFARPEHYKFKKLKDVWRRPTGIDSKQIEEKRGKPKIPKIGYKKSNLVTGLHPFGFRPVIVHNINEVKKLNPTIDGAIIAKSIGRKKRNEIIKIANTSRITILNPRKGEL